MYFSFSFSFVIKSTTQVNLVKLGDTKATAHLSGENTVHCDWEPLADIGTVLAYRYILLTSFGVSGIKLVVNKSYFLYNCDCANLSFLKFLYQYLS